MTPRHAHIPELQSIRGLAAIVVLLHHSSFFLKTAPEFHYWTEFVLNAHGAVVMFFVLSGYVLCRSLSGPDLDSARIAKFYTQRMFRIYPAVWIACILAVGAVQVGKFMPPLLNASQWYIKSVAHPLHLKDYFISLFLAGSALIHPMWSVRVEILASFGLPLIVMAVQRRWGIVLLAISAAVTITLRHDSLGLAYGTSFVVGALTFRYRELLSKWTASKTVMLVASLVLLLGRQISPSWRFELNYGAGLPTLFESVAAAVLISGVGARGVRPLRHPAAVFLGDISYSLYLLHFMFLILLGTIIGRLNIQEDWRALALMSSVLVVTIPIATLMYQGVELRGIAAGRVCSAFVFRRLNRLAGTRATMDASPRSC